MSSTHRTVELESLPERLQQVALGDFLNHEQCVAVYHIIKQHQKGETDEIGYCQELRNYLETTDCESKGARPDLLTWAIVAETQIIA
jgi:hypothetical protein